MEIDRERGTGEIGYWVVREARGRGVATRAVRLVCEWAASELGLTTLEIVVHADNAPSHAVARAAASRETGERRVAPREGLPEGRYLVHHWHARAGRNGAKRPGVHDVVRPPLVETTAACVAASSSQSPGTTRGSTMWGTSVSR